jgi:hypothetical protein
MASTREVGMNEQSTSIHGNDAKRFPEREITVKQAWLVVSEGAGSAGLRSWDLHILDEDDRRYLVPQARFARHGRSGPPPGTRLRLRVDPSGVSRLPVSV